MVDFCDGSVVAQMGCTEMRLPIQYCLTYPQRIPSGVPFLDFASGMNLSFSRPDEDRFPALRLARAACHCGNAGGVFFNASNEVAVECFVRGELRFDRIPIVVEDTLAHCGNLRVNSLDDVLAADAEARRIATEICRRY